MSMDLSAIIAEEIARHGVRARRWTSAVEYEITCRCGAQYLCPYRREIQEENLHLASALAPLIERQVREQAAQEIEVAVAQTYVWNRTHAALVRGAEFAAHIVREGNSTSPG